MSNELDGRTRAGRNVTRNSNSAKPGRVPVGAGNKLQFAGKDPAYHYRVVNDNPGRLAMFQQAGWEFDTATEREADKGTAEAGGMDTRIVADVGRGVKGYLMRIPNELFDEDQAAKIEKVKATEDQLKNRNPNPRKGEYGGLSDE
jgi:hypothetical protein